MLNVRGLLLWLCPIFVVSNCQQLLPFGPNYRQDIAFPAFTGQFHAATLNEQQPIRQLSAGFHLNPPPPLPFFQSFPMINGPLLAAARNSFKPDDFLRGKWFGPPQNNLFTPNTVRQQRPESDAQDEEYRKYLKEEAEDLEKENNQNEVTTDFADFSIDSTLTSQPNQKAFVRVKVQGKDYSYTT